MQSPEGAGCRSWHESLETRQRYSRSDALAGSDGHVTIEAMACTRVGRQSGGLPLMVWLGWAGILGGLPVSGCSLLYGADDHQGGRDGGADGSVDDLGIDAAARCAANPDEDDDGFDATFCGGTDCNDDDDAVYPGAPEVCGNGVDEACGGTDGTLRDLLGVDTAVTAFPARTLFSYERPEINGIHFFPTRRSSDLRKSVV